MTGYRSSHFRHSCDRDGCYVEQLPLWDDLIDCFPRGIRPTDIDGMVEINGQFLFLEEKRAGAGPDEGQRRALLKLARFESITVVIFRPRSCDDDLDVLVFGQGPPQGYQRWPRTRFHAWIESWTIAAECPDVRKSA